MLPPQEPLEIWVLCSGTVLCVASPSLTPLLYLSVNFSRYKNSSSPYEMKCTKNKSNIIEQLCPFKALKQRGLGLGLQDKDLELDIYLPPG